jgi:hypothetical protein
MKAESESEMQHWVQVHFLVSNGIIVRYYMVCYGAIRNFKLRKYINFDKVL